MTKSDFPRNKRLAIGIIVFGVAAVFAVVMLRPTFQSNIQSEDGTVAPAVVIEPNDSAEAALRIAPVELIPMVGGGPDRLNGGCSTEVVESAEGDDTPYSVVRCELSQPAFGGLFRQFNAAPYRGKQVRLSGELQAISLNPIGTAEAVGALWIRVEAPSGPIVDNTRNQGIRGSTEWIFRDVAIRVPVDATSISVGYWMQGHGKLFARDLAFESL